MSLFSQQTAEDISYIWRVWRVSYVNPETKKVYIKPMSYDPYYPPFNELGVQAIVIVQSPVDGDFGATFTDIPIGTVVFVCIEIDNGNRISNAYITGYPMQNNMYGTAGFAFKPPVETEPGDKLTVASDGSFVLESVSGLYYKYLGPWLSFQISRVKKSIEVMLESLSVTSKGGIFKWLYRAGATEASGKTLFSLLLTKGFLHPLNANVSANVSTNRLDEKPVFDGSDGASLYHDRAMIRGADSANGVGRMVEIETRQAGDVAEDKVGKHFTSMSMGKNDSDTVNPSLEIDALQKDITTGKVVYKSSIGLNVNASKTEAKDAYGIVIDTFTAPGTSDWENSSIKISQDGVITLKANRIVLDSDEVVMGSGIVGFEKQHPSVKGDAVYECLNALIEAINTLTLGTEAGGNTTGIVSTETVTAMETAQSAVDKVISNHVNVFNEDGENE